MSLLCVVLVAHLAMIGMAAAQTLDIYFIDVEGGEATLIVTPGGQSIVIVVSGGGAVMREQPINGIRIRFGRFTFLDLGDLPGANLSSLVCGVASRGDSQQRSRQGRQRGRIMALRGTRSIEDVWQLYRTRK